MMTAGLSNPQVVRLVRRRGFGLPLASGAMVFPIFAHLIAAIGPSGRALTARMPGVSPA